ncbi:hypothetical protein BDA99DRAFT_568341 [Phascolomyces articulosus]|uniref:Uncharacterized protein n=1 Tax=Phascolomyces articulosus TaxID=60185 RepID=A0AAD5PI76_9FUNG|nr:hypothetical protein BDA99DRAFT_568341 [Phascolomyces articulosus]
MFKDEKQTIFAFACLKKNSETFFKADISFGHYFRSPKIVYKPENLMYLFVLILPLERKMVSYPGGAPPPPQSTQSYPSYSQPQSLQYMDNVMSRFGHHMSADERTSFSQSMVPTLQSSAPPGSLNPHRMGTTTGLSMPTVNNNNNTSTTVNGFTNNTNTTATIANTSSTLITNHHHDKQQLSSSSMQMDLDSESH